MKTAVEEYQEAKRRHTDAYWVWRRNPKAENWEKLKAADKLRIETLAKTGKQRKCCTR